MRPRSHPDHAPTRHRLAAAAAVTAAALVAGVLGAPAAQAADPVTINLVTINDFHGRIQAAAPSGGIAALATAVDGVRSANPNTIFASAGDNIGASTFTSFIQQDNPTIDALNLAGLDVSAVGNHEFDRGFADLTDRVVPRAEFPYLGANVYVNGTTTPALEEYSIEEVGGVRVGFIGAVTEELPSLVSPAGIAAIDVGDIPEAVNRVAGRLSDGDETNGEADIVVALVHEGAATSDIADAENPATPMGRIVNGLDANTDMIVSAHTHAVYNHEIGGRPVIQSGQYGERFNKTTIVFNPDTGTIESAQTVNQPMYTGTPPVPVFAPRGDVAALVADAVAVASVEGAKKVGDITADFNRGIQPRTPTEDDPSVTQEARGAESTLGNFVADVQLATALQTNPDTQIAFMNPGGLRQDLKYASSGPADPDGNVTFAEAAAVQPFANTLVTMTMTGDQVRLVLEQQWQPATASRPFLKLGVSAGLTYTTDYAAAAGSRVQNLRFDGAPVDPAASYEVVVNSFLASGGDNFGVFAEGTNRADTGQVDLQGMVDWFAANGTATPDLAQRSIGVMLSVPPEGGYVPGGVIDLTLSSLDFTTIETPAGTVDVSIGGVAAGSAAIDRSLVANDDQAGRATLSVTVPAGVSGTVPLTITTPTGTTFEVPITVAAPVEPIEKVDSKTFGFPHTIIARRGATISYTAIVVAGGVVPTGEVSILDGSTVIATATLTEADNGIVTVKLPALGRGVHRLSAEYAGSDEVEGSTSRRLPVLVL